MLSHIRVQLGSAIGRGASFLTSGFGASRFGENLTLFVMLRVRRGHTPFSPVSLQTLNLAGDGDWCEVTANSFLSVSIWLGHLMTVNPNSAKGS